MILTFLTLILDLFSLQWHFTLVTMIYECNDLDIWTWTLIFNSVTSTWPLSLSDTGQKKAISMFDLDIWPMTLTFKPILAKVKVNLTDAAIPTSTQGTDSITSSANKGGKKHYWHYWLRHISLFGQVTSIILRNEGTNNSYCSNPGSLRKKLIHSRKPLPVAANHEIGTDLWWV